MYRIFIAAVLLTGCDAVKEADPTSHDQCLRREIFIQCLQTVPKGPEVTHNNAWDGVVEACESSAWYQSQRRQSNIKPECRP
jgi:hypothetical protein